MSQGVGWGTRSKFECTWAPRHHAETTETLQYSVARDGWRCDVLSKVPAVAKRITQPRFPKTNEQLTRSMRMVKWRSEPQAHLEAYRVGQR